MAGHPYIVPSQHGHREDQDSGIEEFLARTVEQRRKLTRKGGDQGCTGRTSNNAVAHPTPAAEDAFRCRQHNADDQAGFDDFAKDDQ